MDPRSPYIHHTRYVPRHPQPPPPPQPQPQPQPQPEPQSQPHPDHPFPNNPNVYAPHHSTLLTAPPPLRPQPRPPPPQPSYHSLPAPPQFNPHNSQFSYNPNSFNSNHPRSHPDVHNFPQSPRFMHHKPFDDDLPRRLPDYIRDDRPDLWDSPRFLPDRWPSRPYPPANLEADSYRRPLDNQPMSPVKIRRELEGNSRFVGEHKQREEHILGRGDDNYHRRGQFGSTSNRSSRDFRMVSNQMNHSSPGDNLRGLPFDDGMDETQRWVHDREVNEDAHFSFIERGSNEIGDAAGIRVAAGKREHYRCREVNAQLERHSSKGSREDNYEFSRISRKPPQKKSVLLRIQKPNYRNREDERLHYLGYLDDNKYSSFRGKEQNMYQNHDMEEQVREGSPVELDVSFKSNSLVAKAIATPSSAGLSDLHVTPRNEKVRKVLVLNKDSSGSSAIKPSAGTGKLENAALATTSSSDRDLLQPKVEAAASGIGNVHDSSSLPGSSRTITSVENSKLEISTKSSVSNKGGTNVISGKTSSLKVAKNKKIVKRVVKKVVNPLSSSSSQPTTKCDGSLTADGFAYGLPASSEPEKSAAEASVDIVIPQPHSNETIMTPDTENDRVERFAKIMVSDNDTITDSGGLCVPNIKRKRSHSSSPLGSSGHKESKINEKMANGNSANYLHVSSTDKDFGKLLDGTASSDIDSLEPASKQFCLDADSLLLENNAASGSPKDLEMKTHSAEGNTDFGFLSSEEIKIHEGPASSCNTTLGCESDSGLISDGVTVSDIRTTDVRSKEACINQGNHLVENGVVDQFLNANFSAGSGKIFWQSYSVERTIQNVAPHASCSNEVGTHFHSDSGHTIAGEINFSCHGTIDDVCKRPSSDRVSLSLENVPTGGSPNCMISTDGSKEDTPSIKNSNTNVEMPQLHISKSEVNNSYLKPVNMVISGTWVDTTLRLSFKDPTPTEFTVSGGGSENVGLQGCKDGISDFYQRSSPDVMEANVSVNSTINVGPDGTSPKNQKKRKFSCSQLESTNQLTRLMASYESEGPLSADISELALEVSSNSGNGLMQPEVDTSVSAMNHLFTPDFPPLQKEITVPLDNCSVGGYHGTVDSLRDGKQLADATLIMAGSSHQSNSIHIESGEAETMDLDAGEQDIVDSGTAQCQFPSELRFPDSSERLPSADVENDFQHMKNDLPSMSSYLSSLKDGNEVSNINSSGEGMGFLSDTLSDMDCLETLPDIPGTSHSQLSIEEVVMDQEILLEKHAIQGGSNASVGTTGSPNTEINSNSNHGVENDFSFSGKNGLLPLQNSRNSTQIANTMSGGHRRKIQPAQAVSKIFPGRSSVVLTASKNTASSTHISKPRTWHRTENPSTLGQPGNKAFSSTAPTQWKFPKKITKFQNTSYIRKGNSLVRKPTTVAAQSQSSHGLSSSVNRMNSLGTDELKKNAGSDTRTGVAEPSNFAQTGVTAAFERPRTPPLTCATKLPNHATNSLGDCKSSLPGEPLHNCAVETSSDNMNSAVSNGVLKSSENAIVISENPITQTGQINNLDCHNEINGGIAVSSNANSITYVKRKSNQLVATSRPCSPSVRDANNIPGLPSDGYYKRRKNQLVRTSVESHVQPTVIMPDESVNPKGQTPHNITSRRSSSKRRSRKAVTKSRKPSKFSFVWTLHSAQLSNDDDSLHRQKFLPHLFPWKRATYWRSFTPNTATNPSNSSLSTISRKLLLLRKRDTVYTRSKHGFSLRKSKVLSVGGSSLKWSKSIEKRSKKANEEATLAVAEAEKKKREQSDASGAVSGTKNRNCSSHKSVHSINLHPGERIFRIGSFRYKMDSSRRTLQRISDEDSSCSAAFQTEKDSKRPYVPRRLVIGKDEYVRIGNGNQLVRDPKKRTRILASEKVRWSLHTARSRLARKRKYCQFFTRFGKCNKDDGKCPYIHDASKIAVCTKFLNGLCFNSDCKLTHKVIPERMPDCSYYLQGLCTNKNCPYRHVHVNPNASTCEGFLRGYCADGNECRKKHSYVCPAYEATGSCPQGSKCKLHHPKNRSKGKKSKQSREKKNALGRYFGSMHTSVSEPGTALPGTYSAQDNSKVYIEGSIGDYISLDDGEAARETIYLADEQASFSEGDPLDLQLVELDELIKPIRIMT